MSTVIEAYFVNQDNNHIEETCNDLEESLSDVSHVSRILHGIENGRELSIEILCDLCVCLSNAERRLAAMKEAERRVH